MNGILSLRFRHTIPSFALRPQNMRARLLNFYRLQRDGSGNRPQRESRLPAPQALRSAASAPPSANHLQRLCREIGNAHRGTRERQGAEGRDDRLAAETTQEPAEILRGLNHWLIGRTQGGFATCIVTRIEENGNALATAGRFATFRDAKELPLDGQDDDITVLTLTRLAANQPAHAAAVSMTTQIAAG
jgi:hypothetical protein